MNYYAHGGQAHGLKALASELPKHGRNGDTMVAHINPQEAQMLKAMGGSGTINPTTGLPEFGWNPIKSAVDVVKGVVQPVYNATFKNIPGVDQALVGLDKTVGEVIPGGWGTLGMAAASFIPGMTPVMMAGLGALNGSGALRPNGKFNLQGALMGGAMAYGMANLSNAVQAAGNVAPSGSPSVDIPTVVTPPAGAPTTPGVNLNNVSPGSGNFGINPAPSGGGGFNVPNVSAGLENLTPTPSFGDSVSKFASDYGRNVSNFGQGIANVSGLGPDGVTSKAAMEAATGTGAKLTNTALPIVAGTMGLADIEAQRNYEKQMNSGNNAATAEWNAIMAGVEERRKRSEDAMRAHPYQFAAGGMPRFLSGGGDGLSDDIPATIAGKQPAKLADGEFVVSADVVSGLGGGSSKAGAKKLYSMMDRVRQQAHGTKKQVRKVSNNALPA